MRRALPEAPPPRKSPRPAFAAGLAALHKRERPPRSGATVRASQDRAAPGVVAQSAFGASPVAGSLAVPGAVAAPITSIVVFALSSSITCA